MKFKFEGLDWKDGNDIIEINFNFRKYSELIEILEPEEEIILIPEKFKREYIFIFKEVLEKIEDNSLTDEEKITLEKGILKGLVNYFKMNKEFYKIIRDRKIGELKITELTKRDNWIYMPSNIKNINLKYENEYLDIEFGLMVEFDFIEYQYDEIIKEDMTYWIGIPEKNIRMEDIIELMKEIDRGGMMKKVFGISDAYDEIMEIILNVDKGKLSIHIEALSCESGGLILNAYIPNGIKFLNEFHEKIYGLYQ